MRPQPHICNITFQNILQCVCNIEVYLVQNVMSHKDYHTKIMYSCYLHSSVVLYKNDKLKLDLDLINIEIIRDSNHKML